MIKSGPVLTALIIIGVIALGMAFLPWPAWPDTAKLPAALTDLYRMEQLQARFNQDDHTPRLILVLSPT